MSVTTNNVPRLVIDAYELTPAERKEFDYLDWARIDAGEDSASFARYRGTLYDLGEFELTTGELAAQGWQGQHPDSFFSATLIKYADDNDYVVFGLFLT